MTQPTAWGTPLWHATARNHRPRPALQGDQQTDLAIIGGGFTGLSTALHAAQNGQSAAVIEAETIAWGATGRNAGFVVPNFAKQDPDDIIARLGPDRGERLIGFAAGSADLVFRLIARHAIDCDAQQSGWIQPAHSPAAFARIQSRAAQWATRGRPAQILDRNEIAAVTGARGYAGGWTDHSGGVLNPTAYANGLADAAEAALAPPLARSYFPLRVHQVATHPLPASIRTRLLPGNQSISDSRRNLFTFRFDAANRLITGGMDIIPLGAGRRVPRAIHRRLARLLEIPDLPPLQFAWSGLAAVMPDFLPRLIELAPNLLAGIACNGRGIALTTALGQTLADWSAGTALADLPVPAGPPSPLPYHGLARYAPNALLPLSMLRDAMDPKP